MTARTRYQIGNAVLGLGILMLVAEVLMMAGVLPNHRVSRMLNTLVIGFVVVAGAIRRNARAEMAADAAKVKSAA